MLPDALVEGTVVVVVVVAEVVVVVVAIVVVVADVVGKVNAGVVGIVNGAVVEREGTTVVDTSETPGNVVIRFAEGIVVLSKTGAWVVVVCEGSVVEVVLSGVYDITGALTEVSSPLLTALTPRNEPPQTMISATSRSIVDLFFITFILILQVN